MHVSFGHKNVNCNSLLEGNCICFFDEIKTRLNSWNGCYHLVRNHFDVQFAIQKYKELLIHCYNL